MARISIAITVLLVVAGLVLAQPTVGYIRGSVNFDDGTGVTGAMLMLSGVNGGHSEHLHYNTVTAPGGAFWFDMIPAGTYEICASLPMRGFASALVEVRPRQQTNVTLTLHRPDSSGHHGRDSLTVVELSGIVIVEQNPADFTRYLLDVDGNGTGDYRLEFGPPWYLPPSGATRPVNGDTVSITGGLFTYTNPPLVIVYTLDNSIWRQRYNHGGHGGGDHGHQGCNADSVVRVEFSGTAIVHSGPDWHGGNMSYACNTNNDPEPEYLLDFGRADYVPPSGATRPRDRDHISIVGGQIYCRNAMTPIVLVYEINGLLWREPGDTLGLGAVPIDAVDEPYRVGEAISYLTARNYPNPFNPTTTIDYSLPTAGQVKVTVFDIVGREVTTLVNARQAAGEYAVLWDASHQPSGIYFYRVSVGAMSKTFRMILMK
jgi:hypothetical protein